MTTRAKSWRHILPHLATAAGVCAVLLAPSVAAAFLGKATNLFLAWFDWLILFASTGIVILCAFLAVTRYGDLRLGGADARPEFDRLSWFAMLFAAGMGAGLVFWGAAEPLIHTLSPPDDVAAQSPEAARAAMAITMLHWAIHPWAIYAMSALAVAYFAFRNDALFLPSAPFRANPKGRLWVHRAIDWVALIAVLFGVVASLGRGVLQMAAGVEVVSGAPVAADMRIIMAILASLFAVYMASALGGLRRGIKPLSDANMVICVALMLFVFVAGPTVFILETITTSLGEYVAAFFTLSLDTRHFAGNAEWTRGWTLTYFLWWIAWGPFVGVFIARISRGRTIREFVLGVVVAPSVFSLIWFSVLGGAGLHLQLFEGVDLGVANQAAAPYATFVLLEQYPFAIATQVAAFFLIFVFLVTSADSGAYVLAMFSSGGVARPPTHERAFWGVVTGLLTAGALLAGADLNTTAAFAVVGGAPLLLLLIWQTTALFRRLVADERARADEKTEARSP